MAGKYRKDNRNQNQKRPAPDKEKEGAKKMKGKRCQHCGCEMRARGASDGFGSVSWKCRNKACGRTLWIRKERVTPPVPLVYMEKRPVC